MCIVCANTMVKMCVCTGWGALFVIDNYYVEDVAEPSKQMRKGRRRDRKQPQNKTKQNKKGLKRDTFTLPKTTP